MSEIFEHTEAALLRAEAHSFFFEDEKGGSIKLPYRVYFPAGYDAQAKIQYPLVFFLHGHGECGTDNCAQLAVLGKSNAFLDALAERNDCVILAPQTYCDGATNVSEWIASGSGIPSKHIWDSGLGGMKARSDELSEIPYTLGLQAASALLDEYLALPTVDLDRVYLAGISMGGCGAWELAARRPETFAALVPICGSGILSSAARLVKLAIWAFHGMADATVLPEGSEKMCDAINAAGGHAVYTGMKGVGHDAWIRGYATRNENGETAAEWIMRQRRAE